MYVDNNRVEAICKKGKENDNNCYVSNPWSLCLKSGYVNIYWCIEVYVDDLVSKRSVKRGKKMITIAMFPTHDRYVSNPAMSTSIGA